MKAIVYTSNTGSTARYAKMLGHELSVSVHGAYKLMMGMMVKTAGKALADKADRTPEEDDMLDMMMNGGNRVQFENLKAVIDWARDRAQ